MFRLLGKSLLQNCASLLLVCVGLITGRCVSPHGQRIENGRFPVVGIVRLELLHRLLVGQCARAMIEHVGILVKDLDGGNVVAFSLRFGACRLRPLDSRPTLFQDRRVRRFPNGMVVGHSEAPKSHAAGRIPFSDFGEYPGGLFVSERMEDGHGAIEPRLHSGVTGNGKVHFAKLSELTSGVLVLGNCRRRGCEARAREREVQNACQSHFGLPSGISDFDSISARNHMPAALYASTSNGYGRGVLGWAQGAAAGWRGIMIGFLGKASTPAGVFHWRNFWMYFLLASPWHANVECALGLGGFLEAAPIYRNGVAGGRRHYLARGDGGGGL